MGIHRQMPDALRRLHPRYRTPWIGILVFCGRRDPGHAARARRSSSAASTRSARCCRSRWRTPSVVRLRAKQPDFPRPYRGPGNVTIRGYDLPLFALVGGGVHRDRVRGHRRAQPGGGGVGVGWLPLGIVVYALFRRRQGLDLTSTHKVAIAQPVVDHEAEYDSVLVPLGDGSYDE